MSPANEPLFSCRQLWWTISGAALLGALRRCQAGEHADVVYAELYANSDHQDFGESSDA